MAQGERFVTVATLDPCLLGDDFAELPPHVTLCPPFVVDPSELDAYHGRMQEVMSENPDGVRVIDVEPMDFGDHGEIPAYKTWTPIINGGFPVHLGAFIGAQSIGAEVDGRYALMEWNPHMTHKAGMTLPETPFSLSEVQLFRYRPDGMRRVIAVYAAKWASILEREQW